MRFAVTRETPLSDDIRAMVAALNGHLRPLSPPEFQFQLTVEQMAGADTTVFVVRDAAGAPVGMGALKVHDAELGEVKRMWTDPDLRRSGIGRIVLAAIETEARETRIARLVLETGDTPGFEPAWTFYEGLGFSRCGAVLDYPNSPFSRFYEKHLTP